MKYKIGTAAKLLGVSPETLRLYERNGILVSDRGEGENGYRYYSRLDITALMRARSYHQYGFSMQETEALINTDDTDYILEEYKLRAERLEEEILFKRHVLDYLQRISALLEQLSSDLWTVRMEKSPGMYRLEFMKGNDLLLSAEQMGMFSQWVGLAPFAFPSQRNSWEALKGGADESYSALGILEEDARKLAASGSGRPVSPGREGGAPAGRLQDLLSHGVYYPPSACLYTVVEFTEENASCVQYLSHLLRYVKEHRIKAAGDPICRTFLSMNKKENYHRFRQVWLPVEEEPGQLP